MFKFKTMIVIAAIGVIAFNVRAEANNDVMEEIYVYAEPQLSSSGGTGGNGYVFYDSYSVPNGLGDGIGNLGWLEGLIEAGIVPSNIDPDPPTEDEIEETIESEPMPEIVVVGTQTTITDLPFSVDFYSRIAPYLQVASPFVTDVCTFGWTSDLERCWGDQTYINPDWPVPGDCTSVAFVTTELSHSEVLEFWQHQDSLRDTAAGLVGLLVTGVGTAVAPQAHPGWLGASGVLSSRIASSALSPMDIEAGDRLAGSIEVCDDSGDIKVSTDLVVVPGSSGGNPQF